jgi:acetate kinase
VSNIPGARAELIALAEELRAMRHAEEAARILAVVEGLMHRAKPRARMSLRCAKVANDIAAFIDLDPLHNPPLPLVMS